MLKNSIGFVLLNIENNNFYDHIFQNIRLLIENNIYQNIVIYSSKVAKINTYNIPIMHISHAKFFDGDLILFDLIGLILSKNFTNVNKKILYCNDIPWIKNRNNRYNEWKDIFSSTINNLDFIVTNQYLYDIYDICWKKPIDIMENFDYEKIQNIL